MKKLIAVMVLMTITTAAYAYCTTNYNCMWRCKNECRDDGYTYSVCSRKCDSLCKECN